MSVTIQIKRGTGSAVPSSLAEGELAINLDNGKLYFGQTSTSASSAFRFDTITAENITAENYIVSSSVTNITTQTLSGSTAFGDSTDDTHTFIGNITASGNISASGDIVSRDLRSIRDIRSTRYITAEGYISSSASLIGNEVDVRGHITASGNVSGSHISSASFGHGHFDRLGVNSKHPAYTLQVSGDMGVANYIYHNGDDDTHILMETDMINLVAGGKSIIKGDEDEGFFRINNTNANLYTQIMADDGEVVFHVDAGTNKVGIGTNSPGEVLEVVGNISASGTIEGTIYGGLF